MSASVGFEVLASSAAADMICPAWQYPHCGTSTASQARCIGCVPSAESPSMVVISEPCTRCTGVRHDRVGVPFTWTVHAPHCPMPHPYFVPLRSTTSRRTQSSGMSAGTSTVLDFPLTLNMIVMGDWGRGLLLHVFLQRTRAHFRYVDVAGTDRRGALSGARDKGILGS